MSASVLELTDWLSEFLLLSPNFLSLFKRLSVSLSPYLLLITGAGAGSPTLDLKAPVPRLKEKTAHIRQTAYLLTIRSAAEGSGHIRLQMCELRRPQPSLEIYQVEDSQKELSIYIKSPKSSKPIVMTIVNY